MNQEDRENLITEAMTRSAAERVAFLEARCGGDHELEQALVRRITEVEKFWDGASPFPEGYHRSDHGGDPEAPGDGATMSVAPAVGSPTFVPGTLLAERYRIVMLLGKGGMGEVYRADDLKLGLPVALKFLPPALGNPSALLEALHNEVRQARRVSHRQIARVHDIGEAEGLVFLSMEYIEGENLASLLRRIGRLPQDKALELARQLCAGLQALHEEGLLHLDLKPANLMIDERGALRITDFGLTRLADQAAAENVRAGTPAYMAPEHLLRGEASAASDLYAVGVILYEMVTGRRFHERRGIEEIVAWHREARAVPSPSILVPSLPPDIESLILECLERDPARRPGSLEDVLSRLALSPVLPRTLDFTGRVPDSASGKSLVALMFTDLVGSVALQQRLGTAAYMRYVGRHDEIFQQCLARVDDARVLNESGDGFLVRFGDPSDAVRMALALQYMLNRELCQGERIRVRIGLHLGMVTEMQERVRGEKRAVGMPVNLTARIMDLADGGQILMTRAVYEDARHHVREYPTLPGEPVDADLKWVSHGFYEFKGNPDLMEIFEVGAEGISPFLPPEGSGKATRAGASSKNDPKPPEVAAEAAAELEVMAPESVRGSDVFISHSPVDDTPMEIGREGWVTQFHRNLEVRLEQLMGQPVQVWRDAGPRDAERTRQILSFLPEVRSMVSVLSPPFVNASECVREVTEYGKGDSGKVRLVSAEKSPVDAGEMPAGFARLFSASPQFPFYEREPGTGRVREFDEAYGESARQRFFERVYDIAYELKQRLKARPEPGATPPGHDAASSRGGKTVFLAETTSDLKAERDQLQRELLEAGHRVLPEQPLPLNAGELADVVREYLAAADLAIHLVGERYGLIPEDASQSMVELQNQAGAAAHDESGLARFIWSPRDVVPHDERQAQFLQRLVEDPEVHRGAEVIQDSLENFNSLMLEKLSPKPEPVGAAGPVARAAGAPPTVYLICDPRDEEAVEAIEDFLFEQGLEVITPHFEGDEAEVSRMHRQNLMRCDAVLVYYGQASKTWVEMQMMDVVQAPGYGRELPMRAQAVLIAGPDDRRKARFRTHLGDVIRPDGEAEQSEPDALAPFVGQVKTGKGDVRG